MYSGEVASITPNTIKAGMPIKLFATWWAGNDDAWQILNGWHAKIKVELNGLIGERSFFILGRSIQPFYDTEILVGPGVMPKYDLSGYVSIECRNGVSSTPYYQPIIIRTIVPSPPVPPDEEKEFPIIPVAIGIGILLVVAAKR